MNLEIEVTFLIVAALTVVKTQSHAFIQVDNELKYLVDGIPIPMQESLDEGDNENRVENIYDEAMLKSFLIFDPPFLDFKNHPIGMPKMRNVFVQNTSPHTSIHLHSLSGNTMHFHCTFFEDKVIHPGQNTSFDVVYLGREEGFIENTIYVHTSVGTYRYWVKAVGEANPYRIRPLIGLKMPLNSSYSPTVHVHNPHPKNLQITEMYSTGGDLHLEMPDGADDDEALWSIPAYQTKPLMKAAFVARRENNHTAYIRIRAESSGAEFMVIPVEVEVCAEQGLFFPSDCLYFGSLTPRDPPVSLPLMLLNSANKHIHIQNIIASPVNDAISIDFKPIKIPPGTVHPAEVAVITFDPSKVSTGAKVSGKLIIKSKISAYKLSVPFHVHMYYGSLNFDRKATTFYSGGGGESLVKNKDGSFHDIYVRNSFAFSVVAYNISYLKEALSYFEIKWNGPIVIRENGLATLVKVRLLDKNNCRVSFNITVFTNVTTIDIPLVAYNGKLTKHLLSTTVDDFMDLGTIGLSDRRTLSFYLLNENPKSIQIKSWGTNLPHSSLNLVSVQEEPPISDQIYGAPLPDKNLSLKPNEYAVFEIDVISPTSEGVFTDSAFVLTEHENISVPYRLRVADGTITVFPKSILIQDSFPGKVTYQDVRVLSTFSHMMTLEQIYPVLPDGRFSFVASNVSQPIIKPGVESRIGHIVFDPRVECKLDCYSGFSLDSKEGQQWASAASLSSNVAEIDSTLYTQLSTRYYQLNAQSFETPLTLDTSEVHGHRFNAKVNFAWPRLTSNSHIEFPLTEVFNSSVKEILIENPSSQPLAAQLVFTHHYPGATSIASLIDQIENNNIHYKHTEDSDFHFIDSYHESSSGILRTNKTLTDILTSQRNKFESKLKIRPSKNSVALFLNPSQKIKIRISFSPMEEKAYSNVMIIRNNLTAAELVTLSGHSSHGRLVIGMQKYKSYIPFEVLHSVNLTSSCNTYNSSSFVVKKSFMVKNIGPLPLTLHPPLIGDAPCENYGFGVVNCSPITLGINSTEIVDVIFTPDFSLFQVTQSLTLQTLLAAQAKNKSQGHALQLKLVATVAPTIVAACGAKIARPPWEPVLYYSILTILLAMMAGTIIRAYLEAEHTLRTTFVPMTTVLPANQPIPTFNKEKVFDLKSASGFTPEPPDDINQNGYIPRSSLTNGKKINDKKLLKLCSPKPEKEKKRSRKEDIMLSSLLAMDIKLKKKESKCIPVYEDIFSDPPEKLRKSTSSESSSATDSPIEETHIKEEILPSRKSKPKKNLERRYSDDYLNNLQSNADSTEKSRRYKKDKIEKKTTALELPYTIRSAKNEQNEVLAYNKRPKPKPLSMKTDKSSSHLYSQRFESKVSSPQQRAPAKAVVAPRIQSNPQPLAPRDHSYSAVVLGNTKPKCNPPVGKILPSAKREVVEREVGVIGQKPKDPFSLSSLQRQMPMRSQQEYSDYLYMRHPGHIGMQPSTSHSWDPRTLSSPQLQALQGITGGLGYDPIKNNSISDNWSTYENTNSFYNWSDDNIQKEKANTPPAPSPSLLDSLSSFSIWSTPYPSSLLPLSSNSADPHTPNTWDDLRDSEPHYSPFNSRLYEFGRREDEKF